MVFILLLMNSPNKTGICGLNLLSYCHSMFLLQKTIKLCNSTWKQVHCCLQFCWHCPFKRLYFLLQETTPRLTYSNCGELLGGHKSEVVDTDCSSSSYVHLWSPLQHRWLLCCQTLPMKASAMKSTHFIYQRNLLLTHIVSVNCKNSTC